MERSRHWLLIVLLLGVCSMVGCRTDRATSSTQPAIPGMIGVLAFTSDHTGNRDIYTLNIATGQTTNLTNTPTNEHSLAWSPQGTRIAFGSNNQVSVMNADGSQPLRLTRTPGTWEAFSPSWTPDSRGLTVTSHGDLFHIPLWPTSEGQGWSQLTHFGDVFMPRWSPTSEVLAFVARRDGNTDVYTIHHDGSNIQRLTTDAEADYAPAWSHDGRALAFVSDRGGNPDIYRMNSDGTHQTPLTDDPSHDISPAWSPDNQYIAFTSDRGGNPDIYAMNADGSNQRPLVQTTANEDEPVWQP